MRAFFRATALAAVVGLSLAGCPNGCSGNGACVQNDICTCNRQWMGADCSQRMCLYGAAWAADASDPHTLAECANQGSCNRVTGECECFSGFEGRACTRMSCPNKCSGNGVCKALKDLNTTVPYSSENWDAARIMGCQCDAGYFGHDCSLRYCPTGDDPLTLCSSLQRNHVQEIKFTLGSKVAHTFVYGAAASGVTYTTANEEMDLFGTSGTKTFAQVVDTATGAGSTGAGYQMRVSYTDAFGARYTAHGVDGIMAGDTDTDATGAVEPTSIVARNSLETALETLPNNKVRDVKVATSMDTSIDSQVFSRRFLVTFVADTTNSINVGLQRALTVDTGYTCTEAGCSPMIKMPFLYRYASTPIDTAVGVTGTISFFTGAVNTDTRFFGQAAPLTVVAPGQLLRLHADSQPQMPTGIAVDTGVSAQLPNRYDMRILVAVVDPAGDASNTDVDVYYTRVIVGNDNINSNSERVGFAAGTNGVWGSSGGSTKTFTTTLDGFTFQGKIPVGFNKVAVAGAPGAYISFNARDIVSTDSYGRWYEILIKLPHATVTPVTKANQLYEIGTPATGSRTYIAPVDENVENVECSSRGTCDRAQGTCVCYKGYTGNSCHIQSAIV